MRKGAGRPTDGYRNKADERLPGTTTVTNRGKDSGGLIYAGRKVSYEDGRAGRPFDPNNWGKGDALLAGTIVHQWIEDDIHGQELTVFDAPSLTKDQANIGFMAYRQWMRSANLEILETEVPLVSETHQYGGTIDAVALVNGERVIFDWKTSNATYQDYIAQVAAYRHLVNEAYYDLGDGGPVDSAYLLRVGKEYGDFHVHFWPSNVLDMGWRWFLAAKELYEMDKKLKKVAA